jgi:hypothetical protein
MVLGSFSPHKDCALPDAPSDSCSLWDAPSNKLGFWEETREEKGKRKGFLTPLL